MRSLFRIAVFSVCIGCPLIALFGAGPRPWVAGGWGLWVFLALLYALPFTPAFLALQLPRVSASGFAGLLGVVLVPAAVVAWWAWMTIDVWDYPLPGPQPPKAMYCGLPPDLLVILRVGLMIAGAVALFAFVGCGTQVIRWASGREGRCHSAAMGEGDRASLSG